MGKGQCKSISVDRGSPQTPVRRWQASSPSGRFGCGLWLRYPFAPDPGWPPADWSSVRIPRNAPWSGEEGGAYRTADFQGSFCGLRSDCWVSAGTRQMAGVPGHQDTRAFSSTVTDPAWPAADCCGGYQELPPTTQWAQSQSEVGKMWSQIRTSVTFALVAWNSPCAAPGSPVFLLRGGLRPTDVGGMAIGWRPRDHECIRGPRCSHPVIVTLLRSEC